MSTTGAVSFEIALLMMKTTLKFALNLKFVYVTEVEYMDFKLVNGLSVDSYSMGDSLFLEQLMKSERVVGTGLMLLW